MSQTCFEDWIEDGERPGGVGRSERQRVFWERVASGRSPSGASAPRALWPGSPELSRSEANQERGDSGAYREGRWASVEIAVVTMLTVVVFGLGWATVDLGSDLGSDPGSDLRSDPGSGGGRNPVSERQGTAYEESIGELPAVVRKVSDD